MKSLLIFTIRKILSIVIIINHKLWKYDIGDDGIINSIIPNNELYVEGIKFGKPLSAIHLKGCNKMVKVTCKNGYQCIVSENHLFYDSSMSIVEAKNVTRRTFLVTKSGISKVSKVSSLKNNEFVFDATIASGEESYFTDGILSHNSIVSAIFIAWYLINNFDRTVVCTSASVDKVKELVDKIDTILINLPFYMKLGVEIDNVSTKKYDNGCKLIGETATENSGAGNTASLLYADEFALVDPGVIKEFFRVIYPTLSASKISKMIITSTARGMNKFYEIYTDAVNGKNYFNPIRTDWFDVEGRDEKWKATEIANLGSEEDFNQEYGNQFVAGNQLLFSSTLLKKMKKYERAFNNNQLSKLLEVLQ